MAYESMFDKVPWTRRLTFVLNDNFGASLKHANIKEVKDISATNAIAIFNFLETNGKQELNSIAPTKDGGLYFSVSIKNVEDAISIYFQASGKILIIDNRRRSAVFETTCSTEATTHLRKKIKLKRIPDQIAETPRLYKNNHGYIPYHNSNHDRGKPRLEIHIANLQHSLLFNVDDNMPALHNALCGLRIVNSVRQGVKNLSEIETRIDLMPSGRSGYCRDCLTRAGFIVAVLS